MDETSDRSHVEQVSIILRYTFEGEVMESFLKFQNVDRTDGRSLYLCLRVTLRELGLNIQQLRGQGYDGASNMSGRYSGLKARVLKENPRALKERFEENREILCCFDALSPSSLLRGEDDDTSVPDKLRKLIKVYGEELEVEIQQNFQNLGEHPDFKTTILKPDIDKTETELQFITWRTHVRRHQDEIFQGGSKTKHDLFLVHVHIAYLSCDAICIQIIYYFPDNTSNNCFFEK
ncbi:Zinc finger MYM-type protein 1 [Holothuria leucospilota]|uniref:Zinc finger MYM-type protein 1 n=1 Tax=Holothuria leucospilota TaxID=206669 RepID=A0A9Q1HDY9_HOLLE|nr:Zinc finger MYM-type protein 1 [Holothuria leucospilota]